MSQQSRTTYVVTDPGEILAALVGPKDVEVLHLEFLCPVPCPVCGESARVKDRPLVPYIDLPVYEFPIRSRVFIRSRGAGRMIEAKVAEYVTTPSTERATSRAISLDYVGSTRGPNRQVAVEYRTTE